RSSTLMLRLTCQTSSPFAGIKRNAADLSLVNGLPLPVVAHLLEQSAMVQAAITVRAALESARWCGLEAETPGTSLPGTPGIADERAVGGAIEIAALPGLALGPELPPDEIVFPEIVPGAEVRLKEARGRHDAVPGLVLGQEARRVAPTAEGDVPTEVPAEQAPFAEALPMLADDCDPMAQLGRQDSGGEPVDEPGREPIDDLPEALEFGP